MAFLRRPLAFLRRPLAFLRRPPGISTSSLLCPTCFFQHTDDVERNTDDVEKKPVGSPGKSIFQSTCEPLGKHTHSPGQPSCRPHPARELSQCILFKSVCFMWEASSIGNVSISSGLVALAGFTGSWIQNWKHM